MVNDIIQGIAAAVTTVKNMEFYDSEAEQDFDPPCFFVQLLQMKADVRPMSQERRTLSFDVVYFPAESEGLNSLYDLAEQIQEALRVITLPTGKKLRGTNIHYEIQDGNLHTFVNYNMTLNFFSSGAESMHDLSQNQTVGRK